MKNLEKECLTGDFYQVICDFYDNPVKYVMCNTEKCLQSANYNDFWSFKDSIFQQKYTVSDAFKSWVSIESIFHDSLQR